MRTPSVPRVPSTPTSRLLGAAALALLALLAVEAHAQPAAAVNAPVAVPADAAPPAAGCITVQVHNVRPGQGLLMLAAYADAETFGKRPVQALRAPVGASETLELQLCGLTGPHLALMAYQDLDSDGKMGRNVLGMPSEPWGSSGKPGAFGPSWDSGKVARDGQPVSVTLSL